MGSCEHLESEKVTQEAILEEDATYSIPGCCGGGCYIIAGIMFCPFCGERI